jgi:hypothetical protein
VRRERQLPVVRLLRVGLLRVGLLQVGLLQVGLLSVVRPPRVVGRLLGARLLMAVVEGLGGRRRGGG